MDNRTRQSHAYLERESRVLKADKIVALLGNVDLTHCQRILEIGCGSGVIISRLAELAPAAEAYGVDVRDNRIEYSGFQFIQVEGTRLPFPDNHFDLVVSNHVIEHVGDREAQGEHLREIMRVMRPTATSYLAVPNKWRLIEPHYRLPFLSWLPQSIADAWVRAVHRGTYYDCVPLSIRTAPRLLSNNGIAYRDITLNAVRATLAMEFPRSRLARLIHDHAPAPLLRLFKPVIPTLIYLLSKQAA